MILQPLEFQTNFISSQKVQAMNYAGETWEWQKVNKVVIESNEHLDFQGIQTTIEPGFVNYFNYIVKTRNELYPPTTWEGAKKL